LPYLFFSNSLSYNLATDLFGDIDRVALHRSVLGMANFEVIVVTPDGQQLKVTVGPRDTTQKLMAAAAENLLVDAANVRLVAGGRRLEENDILVQAGVQADQTIQAVVRLAGALAGPCS
jgi:hypothetical protein